MMPMSERSGTFFRRCAAVAATLTIAGALAGADPAPALQFGQRSPYSTSAPISAPALRFVDAINHFRLAHGLRVLTAYDNLDDKGVLWSAYMAEGNCGRAPGGEPQLCHSYLAGGIEMHWSVLEENIGATSPAGDLNGLQVAFERSAAHRANMLDPRVTAVGIGVAYWGNTMYVAEEFLAG
jgi:uncharacterized protein YkwD